MFYRLWVIAKDGDLLDVISIDDLDVDFTARSAFFYDVLESDLLAGDCHPLLIWGERDISDREGGSNKNLLKVSGWDRVFADVAIFASQDNIVVLRSVSDRGAGALIFRIGLPPKQQQNSRSVLRVADPVRRCRRYGRNERNLQYRRRSVSGHRASIGDM